MTVKHAIKVKVCGMREKDNINELLALYPDFMGLIFVPDSPRYVGSKPEALCFLRDLPINRATLVGVFKDAPLNKVKEEADFLQFNTIQLHGQESSDYCQQAKAMGYTVIKAIGMQKDWVDWEEISTYESVVDYFLFDTQLKGQSGGTGQQFDWNLLNDYALSVPYFLSGGLGVEEIHNIPEKLIKNGLIGLDFNSKFELAPGFKNIALLAQTLKNVRKDGYNQLSRK